MMQFFEQVAEI